MLDNNTRIYGALIMQHVRQSVYEYNIVHVHVHDVRYTSIRSFDAKRNEGNGVCCSLMPQSSFSFPAPSGVHHWGEGGKFCWDEFRRTFLGRNTIMQKG